MPTTETQKQFIQTQKRSRRRITLARLALFILFLLAWETAAGTGQIDPFIFSSLPGFCGLFSPCGRKNSWLCRLALRWRRL